MAGMWTRKLPVIIQAERLAREGKQDIEAPLCGTACNTLKQKGITLWRTDVQIKKIESVRQYVRWTGLHFDRTMHCRYGRHRISNAPENEAAVGAAEAE